MSTTSVRTAAVLALAIVLIVAGASPAQQEGDPVRTVLLPPPALDSIESYGAIPNDPAFDNGPVIQKALAESKGIVFVPGKTYYVSSTIVTPEKTGYALQGVGIAYHMQEGHWSGSAGTHGGANARLVWTGEAGGTLLEYRGYGMSLDQLTLVGGVYGNPTRAGCLLRVTKAKEGFPTGKLNVGSLSLVNADVGILCDREGGENHCDHLTFQYLNCHHTGTVYRVTNRQSVHHTILHLSASGNQEVVFDFQRGGQLSVFDMALGNPATVLRTNAIEANTCNFVIQNLKVDNNAAGWRLLEMQKAAPLRLRVGGHVGNQARYVMDSVEGTPDIRTDMFNFRNWPR